MSARGLHPLATQQCHCSIACSMLPWLVACALLFPPHAHSTIFVLQHVLLPETQGNPLQSLLFRAWKSRLKGRRPIPIFYSKEKSSSRLPVVVQTFVTVQVVILSTMSSLLQYTHTPETKAGMLIWQCCSIIIATVPRFYIYTRLVLVNLDT